MIKVATVCSGIGSPEQAIKELEIEHEVSFACEIDKFARLTYARNHEAKIMIEDMTKCDWIGEEYYSDIFIGGIPCQAFSLAGKRLGELDPRGLLFFDFYRYVKNQQPPFFIIENVKGLLSDNGGKTFENWIHLLARSVNNQEIMFTHDDSLEYNIHYTVLDSKRFGVPQKRERVFIVGIRKDLPNKFRFPIGWKLEKRLSDILETEVDEKYYLSDKILKGFITKTERSKKNGNGFRFEPISNPKSAIASTITAGTYKMSTDGNYISTPKVVAYGRSDDEKQRRRQHFKQTGKDSGSFRDRELIIKNQQYSDTILASPNPVKDGLILVSEQIQQNRIRRLTPLECFRLQGFPDDFFYKAKSVNSDTQLYKQAGNSITVSVMKEIIKNLIL